MFKGSNRRSFQKGLDADKFRANRHKQTLSLRRKSREEHLQKRRREITSNCTPSFYTNTNQNELNIDARIKDLNKYILNIKNKSLSSYEQLHNISAVRHLLSRQRNPPTERVLKSGIVPIIIEYMKLKENDNDDKYLETIKFESAWIITNIAATSYTLNVVKLGAVTGFVSLIKNTSNLDIIEQSIWGLGNIVGDDSTRNIVISTGVLKYLVSSFFSWHNKLQKNAIWAISNFCRNSKNTNSKNVSSYIIPLISKIFSDISDDKIIEDCLWSILYLSNIEDNEYTFNLMNEHKITNKIMNILQKEKTKYEICLHLHQYSKLPRNQDQNQNSIQDERIRKSILKKAVLAMKSSITKPCIRFIGNIVSGTDSQTELILQEGFVDIIEPFSNHFVSLLKREIMWIMSNILAGTHQHIQYILSRKELVENIISSINNDPLHVKREAVWCICNSLCGATKEQIEILIDAGCIEAICGMLTNQIFIRKVDNIIEIIQALECALCIYEKLNDNPVIFRIEECGGLDYLEQISGDQNIPDNVYKEINDLIIRFWGTEKDNYVSNENIHDDIKKQYVLNPAVDNKTNQFTFGWNNNNNILNTKHINTIESTSNSNGFYQF